MTLEDLEREAHELVASGMKPRAIICTDEQFAEVLSRLGPGQRAEVIDPRLAVGDYKLMGLQIVFAEKWQPPHVVDGPALADFLDRNRATLPPPGDL